jgi:hypothetical protein
MANSKFYYSVYAARVNTALVLVVLSMLLCFTVAFAQATTHSHSKKSGHSTKISMAHKVSTARS